MTIPFSTIPEHIQNSIVQKLSAYDIGRFKESSRMSYNTAKKIKTKLVFSCENMVEVEENNGVLEFIFTFDRETEQTRVVPLQFFYDSPLRIKAKDIFILSTVTHEVCERLINFFWTTNSSFDSLGADSFSCSSDDFNRLLMTSSVREMFVCRHTIPKDFLTVPAIQNMKHLGVDCFMDDQDMFSLKNPILELRQTNITSSGINSLLKELIFSERKIDRIYISLSENDVDMKIVSKGLSCRLEKSSHPTDEDKVTIVYEERMICTFDFHRVFIKPYMLYAC